MRTIPLAVLILVLNLGGSVTQAQAKTPGPWRGPCSGWVNGEYVVHDTPLEVQQNRTRHLVRCVFDRIAPTQTNTALAIGYRESKFDHEANNGSCGGVYQHKFIYWAGRVREHFDESWLVPFLRPGRIFNAYVNVWVTARMVASEGWGAWSM